MWCKDVRKEASWTLRTHTQRCAEPDGHAENKEEFSFCGLKYSPGDKVWARFLLRPQFPGPHPCRPGPPSISPGSPPTPASCPPGPSPPAAHSPLSHTGLCADVSTCPAQGLCTRCASTSLTSPPLRPAFLPSGPPHRLPVYIKYPAAAAVCGGLLPLAVHTAGAARSPSILPEVSVHGWQV